MNTFIKIESDFNKLELIIDTKIFEKDIVLKASYNFLDRWYFFFKLDDKNNLILQLTSKNTLGSDLEKIIADFSDELLAVYLRNKLEKENKVIREKIVLTALSSSIDQNNYVSLDSNTISQNNNFIDFDKDIEEILKEIENDPDLKIDEEEINRILKEIEEETANEN